MSLFEIDDLATIVVVAGPNGCGKFSVFDAIRLLKSVYGGYQQDEWRSWFGEFQINLGRREKLTRVFRNPGQNVEICADLTLSEVEIEHLRSNAESVIEPLV